MSRVLQFPLVQPLQLQPPLLQPLLWPFDKAPVASGDCQAEKEVFQGMVHQLMSQLSKARMDKMSVLKAGEGMSVQEQHAHLQQLLMSAKNHSQQVSPCCHA